MIGRNHARRLVGILGGTVASLLIATSVMAHECVNVSKSPGAGAQIIIGSEGQILYLSQGLAMRLEKGVVDFETGEGFHGLIGIDVDGDGAADLTTYIVGPDDELPLQAQLRGAACRGITNIGIYLAQCLST
jgi:hypothetical protein